MTAEDLLDSSLSTGLLCLSGCVTGLGRRTAGDELVGLARAAAIAGIPSVVTTLWNIDDRSAPIFFAEFYAALLAGFPKDEAIGRGQRKVRKTGTYAAPIHWAPFVLMGDVH